MNTRQKTKIVARTLIPVAEDALEAPPTSLYGKIDHNVSSLSHKLIFYSDCHIQIAIHIPRTDTGSETDTEKMASSTGSAEEYGPGFSPDGSEAPYPLTYLIHSLRKPSIVH